MTMRESKKKTLLTTEEAAKKLGIGPEQVRRYCNTGRLSCERLGRLYGIKPSEIERFLQNPQPQRGRPKKKR